MDFNFSDDKVDEGSYKFDAWLSNGNEVDEEASELFGGVTARGAGVEGG